MNVIVPINDDKGIKKSSFVIFLVIFISGKRTHDCIKYVISTNTYLTLKIMLTYLKLNCVDDINKHPMDQISAI